MSETEIADASLAPMRKVRKGQRRAQESGYIVTWDVNSADRRVTDRVRRFIHGETVHAKGRLYRYPGFVDRVGVRYLGQSVLFVRPSLLHEIDARLTSWGLDHEVTPAVLG